LRAYVDSSYVVAIALGEARSDGLAKTLLDYGEVFSSPLLEAELRSVLQRERASVEPTRLLSTLTWVHPQRALTEEINTVLATGYLRGADLWHVAVALFLDPDRESDFLTLDARQRAISTRLGFGPR
jgi:predicted nucleic acid-binding protein